MKRGINVAPASSTAGHFATEVEERQIVVIDKQKDFRLIEGKSLLTTDKHTNLPMDKDCMVFPQTVFNPFLKLYENSKD
jgi:hypothetical protein